MADDEDLKAGELVTANYGWTKPTVGASDDQWGGYLNADLDGIDTTVKSVSTVANAAYPASNPAGYITAAAIPAPYVLPTASTTVLGGVKVDGSTITISGGTISGASASITIGDTAPSSPSVGALWYDSKGGQLYVWYNDGNSSQWVPTTNQMGGGYMPLQGVTNGTDAPPGQIGEVISSVVTTTVPLTNNVAANITSLSLTAGDWDVSGEVWITGVTAATVMGAAINTTSATLPTAPTFSGSRAQIAGTLSAANIMALRSCRASLAATTVYYLIAFCNYTAGAASGTGCIWARRVR